MLKVLQVRIQEKWSYRFRNSKHAKFDRLREQVPLIEMQFCRISSSAVSVWNPNRDLLVLVFKGQYKLILAMVFRERRELLMPLIVDLGFLYPKFSQIFYRQYSLKKLKIRCCRSCCHHKIIHSWWFKFLSGISKLNMGVCMWQIQIEETVDSKLHVIVWVSSTRGNFRF